MPAAQQGYILIADITGYTKFLSKSELEHAQEILHSLLELLIENTKVPLVISRLEGDAVISYALEGSFLQGGTMLEMIDSCYVAFKRGLQLMVINTTCPCRACQNISALDLKFFIHYGSFGLQPLASYTELIGTDVNLVHRLTKNHVTERTGLRAYALFTRAAVDALGVQEWAASMTAMTESYEYIGEVEIFVQDMQAVWRHEKERSRMIVRPEEAIASLAFDFPVDAVQVWDYLTKPETRALFNASSTSEVENLDRGRIGEGTVYQCAHGKRVHPQTIVDWQPFETHTIVDQVPAGMVAYSTYRLTPAGEGTRLTILVGPVHDKNRLKRLIGNRMMKYMWGKMGPVGLQALRQRIEQDLAEGKTVKPEAAEVDKADIRNAARTALLEVEVS